MKETIFKDVVGYEGVYQISNTGLVYSYPKCWRTGRSNAIVCHEGKILTQTKGKEGYFRVHLSVDGVKKKRTVHQLVAESFLNHVSDGYKLVIDHINDDKSDNRVENLQIVTARFNSRKTKNPKDSSRYRGVTFYKPLQKWQAGYSFKGKSIHIGRYDNELDAHNAYVDKLKELGL
jgi:hypothetical protein